MTQEELTTLIGILDVSFSLALLVAFVLAFIRGEIISTKVMKEIVKATVAELLEQVEEMSDNP